MEIYKSLDFSSQKKRIEKTKSGESLVHIEDYENINDLIRRAVRTKTKFVPESDENAVYDDLEEISAEIEKEIDRNQLQDNSSEQSSSTDERSEVKEQTQGSDESVLADLL